MTSLRVPFMLAAMLITVNGCTDSPVQQPLVDTRNTLFPIVEGSEWRYVDQRGEPLSAMYVNANTGATNYGFAFPLRIFHSSTVKTNPGASQMDDIDATELVSMHYLTPPGENYPIGVTATQHDVKCYIQNAIDPSVWVPYGPDNGLPLRPTIGQKVRVLDGAEYKGIGDVATPGFSGKAHRFAATDEWGSFEYWFADGVGFVAFYGNRSCLREVFTIELASFSIPE